MLRFYQVADTFYSDPDGVRDRALRLTFREPEEITGWRTHAYQPLKIKRSIEKRFRIRIRYWEKDGTVANVSNGVFFSAFSRGKRAENVGIHYDTPANWMMLLIYLTPRAPRDAGTSFWEHRRTGLVCRPTESDAIRLGTTLKELRANLENDSQVLSRWREIDRVANIYNRAIIFPCGLLHSASRHFGSNRLNGRLYQSFHFPIGSARP